MPADRAIDLLEPATLHRLRSEGHHQSAAVGATIFVEGDTSDAVYLVERGLLKVTKVAVDGRTSLIGLRGPGSLVGEQAPLDSRPRSASLSVVDAAELTVIPGPAFAAVLRDHPDLSMMLLHQLSVRLRETSARMLEFATADAPSRVASRLADLVSDEQLRAIAAIDGDTSIEVRLPISQAELAEWSGLSRETIVKALRELRQAGLVDTARKAVVIHDFERLHAMGLEAFYPL